MDWLDQRPVGMITPLREVGREGCVRRFGWERKASSSFLGKYESGSLEGGLPILEETCACVSAEEEGS